MENIAMSVGDLGDKVAKAQIEKLGTVVFIKTIYNPKRKTKEMIQDILNSEIKFIRQANPQYVYKGIGREDGRFGEWIFKIHFAKS